MKRFAIVFVLVLMLLASSVLPVFADDWEESFGSLGACGPWTGTGSILNPTQCIAANGHFDDSEYLRATPGRYIRVPHDQECPAGWWVGLYAEAESSAASGSIYAPWLANMAVRIEGTWHLSSNNQSFTRDSGNMRVWMGMWQWESRTVGDKLVERINIRMKRNGSAASSIRLDRVYLVDVCVWTPSRAMQAPNN